MGFSFLLVIQYFVDKEAYMELILNGVMVRILTIILILFSVQNANAATQNHQSSDSQESSFSFNPLDKINTLQNGLISGYADAGFEDTQGMKNRFFLGHFNPIFYFLYDDLILTEAELEFEIADDGETETNLEYADLGLLLNDYMTLVVGKFLSPVGYFLPNLHPTWINKLPTKPAGFEDDEAATESDIGAQVRGGFRFCDSTLTYALFIANGRRAYVEDGQIQNITSGPFVTEDSGKVFGGRIGFSPIQYFEIGVSASAGKIALFQNEILIEGDRHYNLLGADGEVHYKNFQARGEIIQQRITSSSSPIPGGKWRAWYAQGAYRFNPTKFEAVIRYSDYKTDHVDLDQKQWAFGLDYWFSPSVVGKIAYNINSGERDTLNNANTFLLQLAFGF